jgi:hypothetical protein
MGCGFWTSRIREVGIVRSGLQEYGRLELRPKSSISKNVDRGKGLLRYLLYVGCLGVPDVCIWNRVRKCVCVGGGGGRGQGLKEDDNGVVTKRGFKTILVW